MIKVNAHYMYNVLYIVYLNLSVNHQSMLQKNASPDMVKSNSKDGQIKDNGK